MLDRIKLDFTTLGELLLLKDFKDIEVERINSTIVVYIHYPSVEDAERALKIISKYVEKLKEVSSE